MVADCITESHAIEVGLDKRRSLDSVQQTVFAAGLSGRKLMVLIIDRDEVESAIEYRIETTARRFGIAYVTYSDDYLVRWKMTSLFRQRRDLMLGLDLR